MQVVRLAQTRSVVTHGMNNVRSRPERHAPFADDSILMTPVPRSVVTQHSPAIRGRILCDAARKGIASNPQKPTGSLRFRELHASNALAHVAISLSPGKTFGDLFLVQLKTLGYAAVHFEFKCLDLVRCFSHCHEVDA
jgi:hypothetical protein